MDESKPTKVVVDTTPPVLNNPDDFWHKQGRYIYFDMGITEENFDEVNLIYTDSRGRERETRLCSRLKDGRCEKKRSIRDTDHDFKILILDEAGNSLQKDLIFN